MGKQAKVHFLTAYLEYLYDQGIKTEDEYVGDASRFLRFLLGRVGAPEIEAYLATAASPVYRRRLARTLKKFALFARDRLGLDLTDPVTHALHHR